MKGIVRKVMGIMEEQYGVPDTGTRDRMLAMGIRVSIEMALHFDVGPDSFSNFAVASN